MPIESENKTKITGPRALIHFLSSALHLEEQFSTSVYRDYLDPEDWPVNLSPAVFKKIRAGLMVLMEDSARHEQMLHALSHHYDGDEPRDKERIIREFELMEGFELSARDFYSRISSDPRFEDAGLRETFREMAQAEQHHADIVRGIIGLLNDT